MDGFGFMLAFGDLVWVPFTYTLQARFLVAFPQSLGTMHILAILAVQLLGAKEPMGLSLVPPPLFPPPPPTHSFAQPARAAGYYIFRGANGEKDQFKRDPTHPSVRRTCLAMRSPAGGGDTRTPHPGGLGWVGLGWIDLKTIPTERGTRLLCSGWWGTARHINYFGDLLMALAWSLPCGKLGRGRERRFSPIPSPRRPPNPLLPAGCVLGPTERLCGAGFASVIPYFYPIYFAILLWHRELRDEHKCANKVSVPARGLLAHRQGRGGELVVGMVSHGVGGPPAHRVCSTGRAGKSTAARCRTALCPTFTEARLARGSTMRANPFCAGRKQPRVGGGWGLVSSSALYNPFYQGWTPRLARYAAVQSSMGSSLFSAGGVRSSHSCATP
jgi:hypothetical protein